MSGEPASALRCCGVDMVMQKPILRYMAKSVEMRACVAAHNYYLVRRRSAVRPHHISMTAQQGHAEARVIAGDRNLNFKRLRKIVNLGFGHE